MPRSCGGWYISKLPESCLLHFPKYLLSVRKGPDSLVWKHKCYTLQGDLRFISESQVL